MRDRARGDAPGQAFPISLDAIGAPQGAIQAAVERRRHHGETIRDEVARIETSLAELERIRMSLVGD